MAQKKNIKNRATSKPSSLVWIMLILLIMGEFFLYAWSRVQCTRMGYEITREENKYKNQMNMRNNLQIEIARLKSPKRISRIAKTRLGLIRPAPKQTVIIR